MRLHRDGQTELESQVEMEAVVARVNDMAIHDQALDC